MTEQAGTWTVRRLLEWTAPFFTRKGVDSPRLSAELLLAHVLAVPRIKLYTDYERPLDAAVLERFRGLVQRASEHEPIAYLTGRAHFFSLELEVTPDVLIPRPDTETLVENVIQTCRNVAGLETPRILDLCTGSGCVALAIASNVKAATVVGTDISAAAVGVARKNAQRLGLEGRVTFEEGDLFDPVTGGVDLLPFDLVVANPPYIPTAQIENLDRNVRDYEPKLALDGGFDGLVVHRRILQHAPDRLRPGGRILMEIGFDQGELALRVLAEHAAFGEAKILKDYGGNDRVLSAMRK